MTYEPLVEPKDLLKNIGCKAVQVEFDLYDFVIVLLDKFFKLRLIFYQKQIKRTLRKKVL